MEGVGGDGPQEAESAVGPLVEEPTHESFCEAPGAARRCVLLVADVIRREGERREVPKGSNSGRRRAENGLLDDGRHDVRVEVEPRGAVSGTLGEALREPEGRADEEGIHDSSLHQDSSPRTRGWTRWLCCSRTQSITERRRSHDEQEATPNLPRAAKALR